MLDLFREAPHRRWNPLKREWVLVSPNRTERPWLGQMEQAVVPVQAAYDSTCYLSPGNVRAGGNVMPQYTETYVFDNDFSALLDTSAAESMDVYGAGLLRATTERGVCRVICFSPRHDVTLATMKVQAVCGVVDVWAQQEQELGSRDEIGYVQIFENRGAIMGASNPHPHGQVWATQHLPNEAAMELAAQTDYFHLHGRALLSDYLALELREGERIVAENESWVAVVPFWAVWPFEVCCCRVKWCRG